MDHLQSDQERRARWYSHTLPQYVPVEPAKRPADLVNPPEKSYTKVFSLPFEWLQRENGQDIPRDLLATVLDKHGFVVVSGVLNRTECKEAMELAWDWIEVASLSELQQETVELATTPPVSRKDPSTISSVHFPRAVEGGMMPFYGSGHSSFAWKIRSHANVKTVFSSLHETPDLISSLDGIVMWRAGREHVTDKGWFHLDQNPILKPGQECIQGLVNLMDSTPETGGNVMVAKSHRLFPQHYLDEKNPCAEFYRIRLEELAGDDWMEIDPNDEIILDPKNVISLLLKAGDMLLWDSRVAHCSYPGLGSSVDDDTRADAADAAANSVNGLIRAATTVSMMPTERASESILLERKEAVHNSRTLTHWANKVAPLGQERPEHVALESACVESMKRWQQSQPSKVLLDFQDLTMDQKSLVVGNTLAQQLQSLEKDDNKNSL
jgi:hypothetical protein